MAAVAPDGRRPRSRALKTLRRDLAYFAVLGPVLALLERGPRFLVHALLGVIEPLAHLGTRKLSERHLEKVYGAKLSETERRRIARAVTRNFVQGIAEFSRALREGPENITTWVDAEAGIRRIRQLADELPRGFLAVTGHVGNWELAGSILAQNFGPGLGSVIARRHPNARLTGLAILLPARMSSSVPTVGRRVQ